ncbi:MAG: ABC transporter permease, partial [Candidatus Marinimicrobia bacterium]|nr:ABC transporter permease [Candidatus Neomarinimicrobiota bacterium]
MKSRNIKNMLKESFWMAIDSIRKNKLRSSLTLLGISIGVFSVIGVMTAIRTLESSVESGLNVFATNTFVIQKYPGISFNDRKYRKRKNIDYTQYEKLKNRAQLPILVSVSEQSSVRDVKYKDRTVKNSVGLIGGDEGTVRCYNTYIADGRNFINEDIHHIRNVCILGMDVVDRLFPFEDPLGKRIHIEGLDYMVIGLTERQGELFGESKDNFIAIPITSYLKRFSERWTTLSIDVESQSELTYEKTKDEV